MLRVAKVWCGEAQQERYWRGALPTNFCCNRVEFIPAGFLQMQIGRPKILHSRSSRILKAGSTSACNSTSRCSPSLGAAEKIMNKLQNIQSSQQLSWSYSGSERFLGVMLSVRLHNHFERLPQAWLHCFYQHQAFKARLGEALSNLI